MESELRCNGVPTDIVNLISPFYLTYTHSCFHKQYIPAAEEVEEGGLDVYVEQGLIVVHGWKRHKLLFQAQYPFEKDMWVKCKGDKHGPSNGFHSGIMHGHKSFYIHSETKDLHCVDLIRQKNSILYRFYPDDKPVLTKLSDRLFAIIYDQVDIAWDVQVWDIRKCERIATFPKTIDVIANDTTLITCANDHFHVYDIETIRKGDMVPKQSIYCGVIINCMEGFLDAQTFAIYDGHFALRLFHIPNQKFLPFTLKPSTIVHHGVLATVHKAELLFYK